MGIKVALIEDHAIMAVYCADHLGRDKDIEFVGHAQTCAAGLALVRATRPDVVLLDLMLPDGNGLSVCRELRDELPSIRWIVVSSHVKTATVREALRAGVLAIINKEKDLPATIVAAVKKVAGGGEYYSDSAVLLAMQVIREDLDYRLTDTEQTVLARLAAGISPKDIAAELAVTESAISKTLAHLREKLRLPAGAHALHIVAQARALGLIPDIA